MTAGKPLTERDLISKNFNKIVIRDAWEKHRPKEYFEYRKNWRSHPENKHISDYPLHLDVECTTACNQKCPMCERTVRLKEGTFLPVRHLNMEMYKSMITEAARGGTCSLKLNYLGEPLVNPKLPEMIRFAKEQGIIEVMINTNGTLLNEKRGQAILEAGIDSVFISADTLDYAHYKEIRPGDGDLETVEENGRVFFELRNSDKRFSHVQIRATKVVFPNETEDDLHAFIERWQNRVDNVGFQTYLDPNIAVTGLKFGQELPGDDEIYCDQVFQRLLIRIDGTAFPCCNDYSNGYRLGKYPDSSLRELWMSSQYQRLREAHCSGRWGEIDVCRGCDYLLGKRIKSDSPGLAIARDLPGAE